MLRGMTGYVRVVTMYALTRVSLAGMDRSLRHLRGKIDDL